MSLKWKLIFFATACCSIVNASPDDNPQRSSRDVMLSPAQAYQSENPVRNTPPTANNSTAGSQEKGMQEFPNYLILEFSDLQCPDSAKFARNLKPEIMRSYIYSNRARYEWRDFPLPSHADAEFAAGAALCAGNKADTMRSKILANQSSLSEGTFLNYAQSLGLNPTKYQTCLRAKNTSGAIKADVHYGKQLGVTGTPTLIVGKLNEKNQLIPLQIIRADKETPESIKQKIDQALRM